MEEEQKAGPPWWGRWLTLGIGLVFLAGSWWVYQDLAQMEATGGSLRIHWFAAKIYDVAGKWGVAGVMAAMGAFMLYGGLVWEKPRGD
jgi:hypothetical protein